MGSLVSSSRNKGHGAEQYGEDDDFMLSAISIDMKDLHAAVPMEVQVAHYMPPTFPMIPVINRRTHRKCNDSWAKCIGKEVYDSQTKRNVSGITAFYTEFYERLQVFDKDGKFDAVLKAFSKKGQSKISARGAIILRVVKSCLNIESDTEENRQRLTLLGKAHHKMGIRPWMYAIFVQTLLSALATRMGVEATGDVMEAWVHLFAYVMKYMIPPAIKGHVDFRETYLTAATFKNDHKGENEDAPERNRSFLWGNGDDNDPERHRSFIFDAVAALRAGHNSQRGGFTSARGGGSSAAPQPVLITATAAITGVGDAAILSALNKHQQPPPPTAGVSGSGTPKSVGGGSGDSVKDLKPTHPSVNNLQSVRLFEKSTRGLSLKGDTPMAGSADGSEHGSLDRYPSAKMTGKAGANMESNPMMMVGSSGGTSASSHKYSTRIHVGK